MTGWKRQITRTVGGSRKDAERVRNEILVDVQQGRISPASNPAANASPPKVSRKEPIPPTPDELGRILNAAEAEAHRLG